MRNKLIAKISPIILMLSLTACQKDEINNQAILENKKPVSKNTIIDKKKLNNDEILAILSDQNIIWRFKDSQHIKNPILNSLDGRMVLDIKKADMNALTSDKALIGSIDERSLYTLSFNSNCVYRGVYGRLGADKFLGLDLAMESDAVLCPNEILYDEFAKFLKNEILYHYDDRAGTLTLTDKDGQTLIFSQEAYQDEFETTQIIAGKHWQFIKGKNIQDTPLKALDDKAVIYFYQGKSIDKHLTDNSRFKLILSTNIGCDDYHSDVLFGNHRYDITPMSDTIKKEMGNNCTNNNQTHNTLHQFVLNNDGYYLGGGYLMEDKTLTLIDKNGQELMFKVKSTP